MEVEAQRRVAATAKRGVPRAIFMSINRLLELATERHRAGEIAEARRLYQEVLAQEPANAVALARSGALEMQDGHPDQGVVQLRKALRASPLEPRYEFVLGQAFAALGQWPEAVAAYQRSVAIQPDVADVQFALGIALQSTANFAGAKQAYETVIQLQPDHADALNNLGICHQTLGDLAQAEIFYRRSLALRPAFVVCISNLATVLNKTGRIDEAVSLLRAAVEQEPQATSHAVNLSAALCEQRKFTDAEAVLRGALARDLNNADALFNLGNALAGQGKLREAAEQYRRANDLRPPHTDALINLGNVLKELGELNQASEAYEAAIRAQPRSPVPLNNYAALLRSRGRLEEAEATLRVGIEFNPNDPALHNNLGNVLKDAGELEEGIACFRRALALNPADAGTHSNLAYSLSFAATDGRVVLEECLRWNAHHAAPLQSEIRVHTNDRSPGRRLRIGYVSPDFRDHCQSLFTIPLLSHHDHEAFEIFCYSSVERPDEITRRIAGFADVWREARPLNDAELCEVIRADRIDILVDLAMHMAGGRPQLFASKPASIQVAWLAYPGTTGISAMDYRLSDPRLDPPGFDDQYSERTIRLPDSFWCYDPLTDQPAVNALPAMERGFPTLGCLNNPCKLTDPTLALWGGVMRALSNARLLLMAPAGSHRQRLLRRLASHGIAADRVSFVPFRPRDQYLRSYHDIDLGLDTIPYNGHTTSLDSFWMGVPVVTRVGNTCAGRGGLSQLFQLNLLDLAAETDEAFIAAAVAMASDLPRLSKLRMGLRTRLRRSPLMDAKRFARNIESAYRQVSARGPQASARG